MQLLEAAQAKSGATVFGYHVEDPERFGVVEFDESGLVKSIEAVSYTHLTLPTICSV